MKMVTMAKINVYSKWIDNLEIGKAILNVVINIRILTDIHRGPEVETVAYLFIVFDEWTVDTYTVDSAQSVTSCKLSIEPEVLAKDTIIAGERGAARFFQGEVKRWICLGSDN